MLHLLLIGCLFHLSYSQESFSCSLQIGGVTKTAQIYETTVDSPILQLIHTKSESTLHPEYHDTVLAITENFYLYRSLNKGQTWELVTLTGGTRNKATKLVRSHNNRNVIILGIGDEMWTSNDGGVTILTAQFPGHLLQNSLKFHPSTLAEGVRVLGVTDGQCYNKGSAEACGNDLYSSADGGATWTLVRTKVVVADWLPLPNGVNGIISYEKREKGGNMWFTARTFELVMTKDFFASSETIAEQVVGYLKKEDHLFIAKSVDRGSNAVPRYAFELHSGFKPGVAPFKKIKFPANLFQTQYRILDVSEGSTVIAVVSNPGNGTNWADVYVSNSMDSDFSLSLRHVPLGRSQGGIDFKRLAGVDGIFAANVWSRTQGLGSAAVTKISYDKGGTWTSMRGPSASGSSVRELLHVAGPGEADESANFFYSHAHAPGIIYVTGNLGSHVLAADAEEACYVSRDGGWSWQYVQGGSHTIEMSNKGGIAMIAENSAPTSIFSVSFDSGDTWSNCSLANEPVNVKDIYADPFLVERSFTISGSYGLQKGFISFVDFSSVVDRECRGYNEAGAPSSDYELWSPHDSIDGACLLGRVVNFVRRKSTAHCYHPLDTDRVTVVRNCTCMPEDYECDYCYTKDEKNDTLCVRDTVSEHCLEKDDDENCADTMTRGYRKVPGDTCSGNISAYEPQAVDCSSTGKVSNSLPFFLVLGAILVIVGTVGLWYLTGVNSYWRSLVNTVIPDKYLPDIKHAVATAEYEQLQSTTFSPEEEDEGNKVALESASPTSSSSDSEFDPRG